MESCKEFLRRIAKLPNMQSTVRSLLRELRVVCFVESCWEFDRRIARYLIEQSAVRSLFGELQGT